MRFVRSVYLMVMVFGALLPLLGLSAEKQTSTESSKTMHGMTLSQFGDFEKKWKLVTVRFRKDTGELRFTYANETAWQHLQQRTENQSQKFDPGSYPVGSVFAKIGIATTEDPAFQSSAVPMGVRRYQFMSRDSAKYASTDGWGYALFDAEGNTFPGDLKHASMACAACHRLVPERGYVFSQFMTTLSPKKSVASLGSALGGRIAFRDFASKDLPLDVRPHLPVRTSNVRLIAGELTKHIFPGTLDEIRPTLTLEAQKTGLPAVLLADRPASDSYSIVYSTKLKGKCTAGQIEYLGIMNTSKNAETVQIIRFCDGAPR